jgi:hypothetical protein
MSIKKEITEFMEQLFPDPLLNKYMWQHMAASLKGTNENQVFNIYTGTGRNGKSKLVDLISMALGDYKATVPITLVTSRRTTIGGASPEIAQLKGIRYACMQEPSENMSINEGVMKELTGGDPEELFIVIQLHLIHNLHWSYVQIIYSILRVRMMVLGGGFVYVILNPNFLTNLMKMRRIFLKKNIHISLNA